MKIKTANINFSNNDRILNEDFDDIYFQPENGVEESTYIYLKSNDLENRFNNLSENEFFNIAEFGFCTGLNCILAIDLFQKKSAENHKTRHHIIRKTPNFKIRPNQDL